MTMPNDNCLAGIRCPQCGNEDRFFIDAHVMCEVTDDGAEACGDTEWHGDSFCRCPVCDRHGPLKGFEAA